MAGPVRELSEAEVVALAMRHNLDITGAVLSEEQAGYSVLAEEARYPFVFQANAGYTHSTAPSLSPTGDIVTGSRNTIVLGSQLRKDFATGTSVSLSVQGERQDSSRSDKTGAATSSYTATTRLAASQPLLRGAWTSVGEAGLRAARIEETAAREGRARLTSEVVRDVLLGYWELWYATRSLQIERDARGFAVAQLEDARKRRASGALSPVDELSFETRVVSLDESVMSAELSELQQTLELSQILGVDVPSGRWRATGAPSEQIETPSLKEVEVKLIRQSPDLKELEARVELAESRAEIAADPYRPRLDVEGYLEVQGTGTGSGAALRQLATGGALGGYVGVVFETPLTGKQETAAVESARIGSRIARTQLEGATIRVRGTAARLIAQIDASKARRAAAEQTSAITQRQLEAERARFALGTSTPLQVQEAEDAVRRARLRVARATVDVVEAFIQLEHAVGDLAGRYGVTAPKASP